MNLEDLIESIDIVEYISQYVELEEKSMQIVINFTKITNNINKKIYR